MRPLIAILLPSLAAFAVDEAYFINDPLNHRPMLGIEMTPPSQQVLEREGLASDEGVYVQDVYADTAAASMGIQPGDVVVAVNGMPIGSMQDLRNEVSLAIVGEPLDVVVSRNGVQLSLNADAKPWPDAIPYQKLDNEAEQRFRDWQARRMERSKEQLRDLGQEAAALAQRLADDQDPPWYRPARDQDGRIIPATLAWTATWVLDGDRIAAQAKQVEPPATAPASDLLPAALPAGPWAITCSISTP